MLSELAISPRIKRISNALERKRTLDLEDMDLTSSQAFVLGYVIKHREEPVTSGDICRHFDLSHPTVTGILQRLECKGFLTYAEDSTDRRKKQICATEKALAVQQNARARCQETETLVSGSMTEEELRTLVSLLDRVIANIGQVDGLDPCQKPKEEGK
ncbi:MAG: MarR family transcriptional regulator [Oscillospiraceae bacterium]|jgi:MarR family multiple gene transcriptional regulator MgrA|nr:MarR family transcriptional regulator [Oscillospiraceae bacterium]